VARIDGFEVFVRLLALILICGKESPNDIDESTEYRFVASQMEQPTNRPKSYLPYDIYRHKYESVRGGRNYNVIFLEEDQIIRPAIAFPNPGGLIGYGCPETRASYFSKDSTSHDHYFVCIDTARFDWPKEVTFDYSFYTDMIADSVGSRPSSSRFSVFLEPDELKQTQLEMGLETVPPLRLKRRKQSQEDGDIEYDDIPDDDGMDEVDLAVNRDLLAWVQS
jgi:hypothetical protein